MLKYNQAISTNITGWLMSTQQFTPYANESAESTEAAASVQAPDFRRHYSVLDGVLPEVGRAPDVLRGAAQSTRPDPAARLPRDTEGRLSPGRTQRVAGLMAGNHAGEGRAAAQ